MILQLDIGNSRVKWRAVQEQEVKEQGVFARSELESLPILLDAATVPGGAWIASVAGAEVESTINVEINKRWGIDPWYARSAEQVCGLRNSYAEPARMGVDRWLAMLAAWKNIAGPVCVVDAGSALTIDFVGADGQHLGGYILPGIDSMERALLSDTDRVRFGDAARDQLAPGCSTEAAVYNGLLLSQAGSVSMAISQMGGGFTGCFSGGNGRLLRDLVQPSAAYRPDLVFEGLELLAQDSGQV
jgi:type III pantothenate kinase